MFSRNAQFQNLPTLYKSLFEIQKGFLNRVSRGTPRFHFKLACTLEGIVGSQNRKLKISGPLATAFTHLLRAKVDAVMVGMGTIVSDKPLLNVREELLNPLYEYKIKYFEDAPQIIDALHLRVLNKKINHTHYSVPDFFLELLKNSRIFDLGQDLLVSSSPLADLFLGHAPLLIEHLTKTMNFENSEMYSQEPVALISKFTHKDIIKSNFQPHRIFVLGHFQDDLHDFFDIQDKLEKVTQKKSYYFLENNNATLWQNYYPQIQHICFVPNLNHPTFSREVRANLARLGLNEILVEGGVNLLRALCTNKMDLLDKSPPLINIDSNSYKEEDIFYLLYSKESNVSLYR